MKRAPLDPLSKYIIVQYQPDGWWDIYKTQYLDTLHDAKLAKEYYEEIDKQDDRNTTSYKIFELKEVV